MKREPILMLVAGVVFGAVAGFIVTREFYEKKMAAAPPVSQPQVQAQAQGMPGGQPPQFDPDQHKSMMQQTMEKARESKDPKDKVLLANIYYDRGNFEEAAHWYEDALKLDAKDPNVLVDLGVCYKNTNRPAEAISTFDKALALEKDKKEALFNKVVVYGLDLKDKGKASASLKRLKEVSTSSPEWNKKVEELEKEIANTK
jgi:tetratricopeptide (TPR) repeat protein